MKIIGYLLLGYILVFCEGQKNFVEQEITQIRLINNSNFKITNILAFSISFSDLNPRDSTEYRTLKYDFLKDDPLLYIKVRNENLSLYLKIPDYPSKYTYNIDSIQLEKKVIYVSLLENK